MNLSKIMFLIMMIMGTLMSISANSWMGMWMGLEINLLSFIPLITNINNLNYSEAALNYFLIQVFASSLIVFSMAINMLFTNFMFFIYPSLIKYTMSLKILLLTMMIKLGATPFHFWLPNVMDAISWPNCMLIATWQKINPMLIISYVINLNNYLLMIIIILSSLIGALGGLAQTSLRKLLAFSSINHMSWMFSAMLLNENMWWIYFSIYTFLNLNIMFIFKIFKIYYLNQLYYLFMTSSLIKLNFMTSILSLGGLPPFMGFIPKWFIIQSLIIMSMNIINLFLILMSLITLFYYLKIGCSAFMMNYSNTNWNIKSYFKPIFFNLMLIFNFISLFSFFSVISMIYYLI